MLHVAMWRACRVFWDMSVILVASVCKLWCAQQQSFMQSASSTLTREFGKAQPNCLA